MEKVSSLLEFSIEMCLLHNQTDCVCSLARELLLLESVYFHPVIASPPSALPICILLESCFGFLRTKEPWNLL